MPDRKTEFLSLAFNFSDKTQLLHSRNEAFKLYYTRGRQRNNWESLHQSHGTLISKVEGPDIECLSIDHLSGTHPSCYHPVAMYVIFKEGHILLESM